MKKHGSRILIQTTTTNEKKTCRYRLLFVGSIEFLERILFFFCFKYVIYSITIIPSSFIFVLLYIRDNSFNWIGFSFIINVITIEFVIHLIYCAVHPDIIVDCTQKYWTLDNDKIVVFHSPLSMYVSDLKRDFAFIKNHPNVCVCGRVSLSSSSSSILL